MTLRRGWIYLSLAVLPWTAIYGLVLLLARFAG